MSDMEKIRVEIGAGIKEKCSAAELAEMVDVLYEQYKKED